MVGHRGEHVAPEERVEHIGRALEQRFGVGGAAAIRERVRELSGAGLQQLHLLDRRVDLAALLREPRALGRNGGVLGRGILGGRGSQSLQPRIEIGKSRLQVGELVAQGVAQRRELLRQVTQRADTEPAALCGRFDLVQRCPDRIDADQRRLLRQRCRSEDQRHRQGETEDAR